VLAERYRNFYESKSLKSRISSMKNPFQSMSEVSSTMLITLYARANESVSPDPDLVRYRFSGGN